jgi:hypothetical protein
MHEGINTYPMYLYVWTINKNAKAVKIWATIKKTKTNKQIIKQAKLSPTRQGTSSGVAIQSRVQRQGDDELFMPPKRYCCWEKKWVWV